MPRMQHRVPVIRLCVCACGPLSLQLPHAACFRGNQRLKMRPVGFHLPHMMSGYVADQHMPFPRVVGQATRLYTGGNATDAAIFVSALQQSLREQYQFFNLLNLFAPPVPAASAPTTPAAGANSDRVTSCAHRHALRHVQTEGVSSAAGFRRFHHFKFNSHSSAGTPEQVSVLFDQ